MNSLPTKDKPETIRLDPERDGREKSVHLLSRREILAVLAAKASGRPLLIEGEPGTGKSQLARAAAQWLDMAFFYHAVDSQTETRDLLWTMDAVSRLAEAQIIASRGPSANVDELLALEKFVRAGPLWWAFDYETAKNHVAPGCSPPTTPKGWTATQGAVLLIDEIDKADSDIPNGLLDAFGAGRFDVPGFGSVVAEAEKQPAVIVLTTNRERDLPAAFVRRCLVLRLELPTGRAELANFARERGLAHFPELEETLLEKCTARFVDDRLNARGAKPGLAEYLDLLRAVVHLGKEQPVDEAMLNELMEFTLQKWSDAP